MKCNFNNADLENNLDGTVCRYKGIPVIVRCAGGNNLELWKLETANIEINPWTSIRSTNDDFDISTPPLGYAQYTPEQVVYVSRLPVRKWKQGLSLENVRSVTLPKGNAEPQVAGVDLRHKSFSDMMQGIYPSLKLAFKKLKESNSATEVAVSNSCALKKVVSRKTINVYYKNELVGFIPEMELDQFRPKIIVPNSLLGKIISLYLSNFDWEIQ